MTDIDASRKVCLCTQMLTQRKRIKIIISIRYLETATILNPKWANQRNQRSRMSTSRRLILSRFFCAPVCKLQHDNSSRRIVAVVIISNRRMHLVAIKDNSKYFISIINNLQIPTLDPWRSWPRPRACMTRALASAPGRSPLCLDFLRFSMKSLVIIIMNIWWFCA